MNQDHVGAFIRPLRKTSHQTKIIPKPYLREGKKELISHLVGKGSLTQTEAENLKWYRKLHLQSKYDVGGPRLLTSKVTCFAGHFSSPPTPHHTTDKKNKAEALRIFRRVERILYKKNKDLILLIEKIFTDPKNNLETYRSCSAQTQKTIENTFKTFAQSVLKNRN